MVSGVFLRKRDTPQLAVKPARESSQNPPGMTRSNSGLNLGLSVIYLLLIAAATRSAAAAGSDCRRSVSPITPKLFTKTGPNRVRIRAARGGVGARKTRRVGRRVGARIEGGGGRGGARLRAAHFCHVRFLWRCAFKRFRRLCLFIFRRRFFFRLPMVMRVGERAPCSAPVALSS